jgi:LacI family transcriptional regulator
VPTITDVAKLAGVSVGTVSHVLNGTVPVSPDLCARVRSAIRKLDYHPSEVARSLTNRRTGMLGIVIPDLTNPFFPQLVRGAEDAALEHHQSLIVFNTDERAEREQYLFSVLRRRRVDGILLAAAPNTGDLAHIKRTLRAGIPIVCVDRGPLGLSTDSVLVDNIGGAYECIRHLLSLGHRRIAIITGCLNLQTGWERLEGYKKALKEAAIPEERELIREGNFRAESGYQLARELLSAGNRPSALFVSNAPMTFGALKALRELGLQVPMDISVAMFDEVAYPELFEPQLTCVSQPPYRMGYRAAELLISRLESKKRRGPRVELRLPAELKIKGSTSQKVGD